MTAHHLQRAALVALGVLALVLAAIPGQAAHPGFNGAIVYARAGDLWRLDLGAAAPLNLTQTPDVTEGRPSVSPDGGRIAYERPRANDPYGGTTIWVMGLDGANQADITTVFSWQYSSATAPTWASNGQLIAFSARSSDTLDGEDRIWVANVDGSGGMAATTPDLDVVEPAWSPVAGSTEAVVVIDSDLWVFDLDTGAQRLLLDTFGVDVPWFTAADPDWSPDGTTVVFHCGNSDVCAIAADGSDLRYLEGESTIFAQAPSFSPDGTQVVFTAGDASGIAQLVTMPVEGSAAGLTRLTTGASVVQHPSWARADQAPPPPPPPGGDDPPAPEPGHAATFDGDPATTERIDLSPPTTAAMGISQVRFADGGADHVVLSRDDAFPDSLAGSALTGYGPLLFTSTGHLTTSTAEEIRRVLGPGGVVYLLGGVAAISPAVGASLVADGYEPVRLAGASRVETALVIADEVDALYDGGVVDVLLARSHGVAGNQTSGWADSVTAGGLAAWAGVPILLTSSDALHPAVAAWLAGSAVERTFVLGGAAAVGPAIDAAVPGPVRVAGADRTETAATIATDLWGATSDGPRDFVVIHAHHPDGWAYGLAAAGLSADAGAPLLMVDDTVPPATMILAGGCGLPEVDLVLVGDASVITPAVQGELDGFDGGLC